MIRPFFRCVRAVAVILSLAAMSASADAQTDRSTDTGSASRPDVTREAPRFNPGWLGLVGLIGLAGLMGRNENPSRASHGAGSTATAR